MPRGDRRGPNGMGQMTGRGMGFCNGYDAPGYANAGPGFGRGMGRVSNRGRGMGRRFWATRDQYPAEQVRQAPVPVYEYKKEDEIADLKAEKEMIERELNQINERLKEVEKKE